MRIDRLQSELMEARSQLEAAGTDNSAQLDLLQDEVARLQGNDRFEDCVFAVLTVACAVFRARNNSREGKR